MPRLCYCKRVARVITATTTLLYISYSILVICLLLKGRNNIPHGTLLVRNGWPYGKLGALVLEGHIAGIVVWIYLGRLKIGMGMAGDSTVANSSSDCCALGSKRRLTNTQKDICRK